MDNKFNRKGRYVSMETCCGACHIKLKDEDVIAIDQLNTFYHLACANLPIELIEDVGLYKNMQKYVFVR